MQSRYHYILSLLLALIVCYFAFLWQIDAIPALLWDESRQLLTAYEMYNNHDYLVTYFDGQPDFWNSKPPLLIWLMTLSYKLFGFNITAARLPSALSGVVLSLFIYWVFAIKNKKPWLGFLAVLILCSIPGYVSLHVTRTADYDGLLVLFCFLYAYHFFQFIYSNKPKHMRYSALFFVLAVLTKGIAATLLAPGILVFTLIEKKAVSILKNKWFYVYGLAALAVPIAYYLYREVVTPGFLGAVTGNELTGRYANTLEGNSGPWYYYIENFWVRHRFYIPLFFYVPFTMVALLHKGPLKKLSLYAFIVPLSYFVVLSAAKTKLWHYDAPAYPFMAITTAIGIYTSILYLKEKAWQGKLAIGAIGVGLVFLAISGINNVKGLIAFYHGEMVNYGNTFKRLESEHPNVKNVVIYYSEYNASELFYERYYTTRGYNITGRGVIDENFAAPNLYTVGDTVMICHLGQLNHIKQYFNTHMLVQDKGCEVLILESEK